MYLCSTLFTVASGYSLSADSGTIFSLHLFPTLLANPTTVLKTVRAKCHPGKYLSVALSTGDVCSQRHVQHTYLGSLCSAEGGWRSKYSISFMFSKLCMKEGRLYTVTPLMTCMRRDTTKGCVIWLIILNELS